MGELDRIDTNILRILQENADIANATLADRVGLSPSACLRRVAKLRALGAIRKTIAVLDPAVVGRPLTAVINLEFHRHGNRYRQGFIKKVRELAAVRQGYIVTGEVTGVLVLSMRDMAEYTALCETLFDADDNIVWYRTYIATEIIKDEIGVAL
ncbi:Lrp/AsnC family transcriptional regulator [Thalassospira alkalitolerans]|uniref:AsnC family transcriptional regulator n=1 Tax=Thalassospira alkalitolerans TaxID=1293890 RepID=A0A1Y2L8L8_9PROT|nr:Lrp/AsnC family transcriptional regulator [Thalassospira alkalitolerans]OSQ46682.1 AsnC family transcriptional regulator [Thalassospira alkalitolerans]|tara:strand:- start:42221 stop:42682 length:462 start_codon:yes stop_codon:yes gene_type:complete